MSIIRPVDTEELAARLRAAHGWNGEDLEPTAVKLGLSTRQWQRYLAGDFKRLPATSELEVWAQRLEVPAWFLTIGWEGVPSTPSRRMDELERQITLLRAGLVRLVAGDLKRTRELLGLDETDRPEEPPASGQ